MGKTGMKPFFSAMKIKPKQILCVIIVVATNWQKKSWTLKNSKDNEKNDSRADGHLHDWCDRNGSKPGN